MEALGSVQKKISCVFETAVFDEPSAKREHQTYRVAATNTIKVRALENDIQTAVATEKLDGTCCYISEFEDLTVSQQRAQRRSSYWIPASGVEIVDGSPIPDDIGHTPGWVPISSSSRPHCWHLQAVDLKAGLALVLREELGGGLFVECVNLSSLTGHTAELIGTNINGNPYGLGTKKNPIHLLVIHGTIKVENAPPISLEDIRAWFKGSGQVHRNHVSLKWPVSDPTLTLRPVKISMDTNDLDIENDFIATMAKLNGHTCDSLKDLERIVSELDNIDGDCDQKNDEKS
ncbi:CL029-like protein [Mya arenaria]|uniref:RNA ligase 1 n=1 Tax=Mya arenaria TaxID=6604 RepID=A0ABY7E0R7_MYAAR|nr:CL029-like protein [Mya arenaria]